MGFVVDDITWWQLSLYHFMNSWLPSLVAFLIGMLFESIRRKMSVSSAVKNRLLEIIIPVFNTGQVNTFEQAQESLANLTITLNTYSQIYPKLFGKGRLDDLRKALRAGFVKDGQVNSHLLDPNRMIELIRRL